MNLESLHAIAAMVAQQRSVEAVLETVVGALVDSSDLALARIWLTRPGDICGAPYHDYQKSAGDREIPVVVLEPK